MATIDWGRVGDMAGDAWDEPDTGLPPCIFCRREIPCECMATDGSDCMCTCGRCMAEPLPHYGASPPPR